MKGTWKHTALALAAGAVIIGCSASAGSGKTEALAADGGDLGKAWLELYAAMKAGDAAKAGPLLDSKQWNLANKQPSWFQMFAEGDVEKPMGGRRHGDRATLFLDGSDAEGSEYRHVGAAWNGSAWVFDSPASIGSAFDASDKRDCAAEPDVFPCGTETAPPGTVSGTVVPAVARPDQPPSYVMLDGFATRMVPAAGAEPTATRVVLSTHGINPAAVAMSTSPDHVFGWLGYPIMKLDIAPDGKSAELDYKSGNRRKATVTEGLTIDTATPGRIKGRLAADVPEIGRVDVSFDLSTASQCRADQYPC